MDCCEALNVPTVFIYQMPGALLVFNKYMKVNNINLVTYLFHVKRTRDSTKTI